MTSFCYVFNFKKVLFMLVMPLCCYHFSMLVGTFCDLFRDMSAHLSRWVSQNHLQGDHPNRFAHHHCVMFLI